MLVGTVANLFLIGLRDAEQHADRSHRHLRAEIRDEVEPAGADEGIESPSAELADLRLEGAHLVGREDPGQQAAVDRVQRRVLEDDDPRRHLDVRP